MLRQFESVEAMIAALQPESPVYCLRPELLRARAADFVHRFPGDVLYAVKCNPLPFVLQELAAGGIGHFDTASIAEIALVSRLLPNARSYFLHPVKAPGAIRAAYGEHGVRHFVVDAAAEVEKLSAVLGDDRRDCVAVVRLATPGGDAAFDLSVKFGAAPTAAAALLRDVASRGFRPGLCFHVGSQCTAPRAYERALGLAAEVLEAAGVAVACLDVGGGFPAAYAGLEIPPLEDFMAAIERGLRRLDLPADCRVMCEPGRALTADGMSLVAQVQLRKGDALYINDGIYGSLHGTTIGYRYPLRLIRPAGAPAAESRAFTVYGPTCDGLDVLPERLSLPADTAQGDWLEFGCIGAYGPALRTDFNGFRPDTFVSVAEPFSAEMPPRAAAQ